MATKFLAPRWFFWISVFWILVSCSKEKPIEVLPAVQGGVLVCNEGNFGTGNATLSRIRPDGTVDVDVFQPANGFSLGDVCQSVFIESDKIYVVVNNSGTIYQLSLQDFKVQRTLQNLTSPRYWLPVNDSDVYVSDLYANEIHIIDKINFRKKGQIAMPSWVEEMILFDGKVWATSPNSSAIYLLDTQRNQVADSISLPGSFGAIDIESDVYGNIWVLCMGNQTTSASLVKIVNRSVRKTMVFPNQIYPSRLTKSRAGDQILWIDSRGVMSMPVTNEELVNEPLISAAGRNFYGLMVDNNDNIWVTDAKDYVQKGDVIEYSKEGNLKNTYKVGIIPGNLVSLQQ